MTTNLRAPSVQEIPTTATRTRFAKALRGSGVEIGPGDAPYPVPAGVKRSFVDRWDQEELVSLFPELGADAAFPKPDIISNLNTDRLSMIPDASLDFVIASHVLEHLADPLGMLEDIYRVLREQGVVIIILPDRHTTFDKLREPTKVEHLAAEHRQGITEVDDLHIIEFLAGAEGIMRYTPDVLPGAIEAHRRRSVHAHVWDVDEFFEVLVYAVSELGEDWNVTDVMLPGSPGSFGNEYGWLLVRSSRGGRKSVQEFRAEWMRLRDAGGAPPRAAEKARRWFSRRR